MSCKVSIRQAGDVVIVDLAGQIRLGKGASQMRDTIKKLAQKNTKYILMNLQEVTYLDSSGLGELVSSYVSVVNAGGQVKLMHMQSIVKQLLQVTKLYTVFSTYEDEALALQSFKDDAARA